MTTAIPQRRGSFFQNKTFIPKVICLAVKITPETETFGYDQLHRLSSIDSQTITYADNGNITQMPGVGTMEYGNSGKPYRVTMLTPTGAAVGNFRYRVLKTDFTYSK